MQGGWGFPWCASSNKDRTKWTWYQCLASTDVPALVYLFLRCWFMSMTPVIFYWRAPYTLTAVGLYVNDSCDLYGRQGAKPRTPINKQSNKFVSCLFACFRIQFLPDHIMIHSCLVCVWPTTTQTLRINPIVWGCLYRWLTTWNV